MRLKSHNNRVKANISGDRQDFQIVASAKAFEILSSNLYTRPVEAIVRELSTNAYDSHIDNNTEDIPFVVHLPSYNDPSFSIRDYGTGMTKDKVLNLYTRFFDSDKTESNDVTGCLGLGSKSPFSYVQSFTVESFHGSGDHHVKDTYLMFKNENGVPEVTHVTSEKTTEPSGICIKMAVKPNNMTVFADAAQRVYPYFKVAPTFIGANLPTISEIKYDRIGKTKNGESVWGIVLCSGAHGSKYYGSYSHRNVGNSYAIMGNVAYRINTDNQLTESANHVIRQGIHLFFDMGDVSFDAGRENLQYDKRTIKAIQTRINDIIVTAKNEIEIAIKDSETLFEARISLSKLKKDYSSFMNGIVNWGEIKYIDKKGISHRCVDTLNVKIPKGYSYVVEITRKSYRKDDIEYYPSSKINPLFVIANIKTTPSRIEHHIRTNNLNTYADVVYGVNEDTLEEFKKIIGAPDSFFIKASDLPKPPPKKTRVKTTSGKKRTFDVSKWNGSNSCTKAWEEVKEIDFEAGGYYVVVDNCKPIIGKDRVDIESIHCCKQVAKMFNIKIDTIYAVKKKERDAFDSSKKWISLFDKVVEIMSGSKSKGVLQQYSDSLEYSRNRYNSLLSVLTVETIRMSMNDSYQFVKDTEALSKLHKAATSSDRDDIDSIFMWFPNLRYCVPKPSCKLIEECKLIIQKYPWISSLRYSRVDPVKQFVEYIEGENN